MRIGLRFVALAVAVLATGGLLGAQEKGRSGSWRDTEARATAVARPRNVEYQKISRRSRLMDKPVLRRARHRGGVADSDGRRGLILIDTAQEPYVDRHHRQTSRRWALRSEEHQIHPAHARAHLDHFGGAGTRSRRYRAPAVALVGRRLGFHCWTGPTRTAVGRGRGMSRPRRDMVLKGRRYR